jgi:hypothetical protein
MICGAITTPKKKQRAYWRMEIRAAKRAMELYPVGSDEREIYRAKYNEAMKQYNSLFEEVYKRC